MSDITQILDAIGRGEEATEQLLLAVYQDLRRLAAKKLSQEAPGQTLQATALVHEAYVRLMGTGADQKWDHRGHFFTAAAEAMRRILIENARHKQALKHGGAHQQVAMPDAQLVIDIPADELLDVNEAIEKLADESPQEAELVKLRYFAGLTLEEAASALGVSRATACRYWAYARAFLYEAISGDKETPT